MSGGSRPGSPGEWASSRASSSVRQFGAAVRDSAASAKNLAGNNGGGGGGGGGGGPNGALQNELATTKWLVPKGKVDEKVLRNNFDPDTVASSVVPSPLRSIRGYLRLGLAVGAFPADIGERYIHFSFEFCEVRTWCLIIFLVVWLSAGGGLVGYCLLDTASLDFTTMLQAGSNSWRWNLCVHGTDMFNPLMGEKVPLYLNLIYSFQETDVTRS